MYRQIFVAVCWPTPCVYAALYPVCVAPRKKPPSVQSERRVPADLLGHLVNGIDPPALLTFWRSRCIARVQVAPRRSSCRPATIINHNIQSGLAVPHRQQPQSSRLHLHDLSGRHSDMERKMPAHVRRRRLMCLLRIQRQHSRARDEVVRFQRVGDRSSLASRRTRFGGALRKLSNVLPTQGFARTRPIVRRSALLRPSFAWGRRP